VTNGKARGEMLWFNEEKGHGYIATDDGERLYVDASGFAETHPVGPCAGLAVEFEIADGPTGRQAHAARMLPDPVHGRARRRRRQ
jgi:CspA family cold shock protein